VTAADPLTGGTTELGVAIETHKGRVYWAPRALVRIHRRYSATKHYEQQYINPLNAELNLICQLVILLGDF
jgi:hypothetical protein